MSLTALIVDDSPTMRSMVKAAMQPLGFLCDAAQDGEKAMKSGKDTKYDIIVTDINMPNMDGVELIRELRADSVNKFTPILVITTEGGDKTKNAGREAGASGWIVKPFQPEVLEKAVRKLCGLPS